MNKYSSHQSTCFHHTQEDTLYLLPFRKDFLYSLDPNWLSNLNRIYVCATKYNKLTSCHARLFLLTTSIRKYTPYEIMICHYDFEGTLQSTLHIQKCCSKLLILVRTINVYPADVYVFLRYPNKRTTPITTQNALSTIPRISIIFHRHRA